MKQSHGTNVIYTHILSIQKQLDIDFLEAVMVYIEETDSDIEELCKLMKKNVLFVGELEAISNELNLLEGSSKIKSLF